MGLSAASFLSREYLCILRRCAWYNAFNYFVAVSSAFYGVSAMADQITLDGRTQTELSINGSITDITTQTIKGANALNSFHRFNIGNGQTVNLYLPNGTANLLNLVHDERSQLDGVMNAYKDGRIGGNVFFLNPHGIVVGAEGSINVGSLTMATPTSQFMDSLVSATSQVNADAVDNVLSGKIPLTESGLIQVKGRINAVDSINLNAGQVMVDAGAHIITGMQAQANFGDLVNIEGIEIGSEVKIENGVISILAAGNVDVAGHIAADGLDGQNAGLVNIQAGGDIHLTDGANVSASGQGLDSSGGVVINYAQGDATLESGAVVAANGGVTGDGGFVEFSAKNTVNINGGELRARAPGGKAGEILIDPTELLWTGSSNDQFKDGESYTITATDRVVLDDVVISTRKLDSADNNRTNVVSATSTGDSGDFTIKSAKIELKNGAAIYAQADNGFTGGTVTLEARDESVLPSLGWATATAQIDIGDATIKADEVVIDAKSNIDSQFVYSSEDPLDSAMDVTTATAQQIGGFLLSLGGVEMVVSDVDAKAHVNLTSGANIEATNGVTLSAENVTKAGMANKLPSPGSQFNTPLGIGALWVSDKSDAQVNVGSGVTIKSGDLSVRAHNDASLEGAIASAKNQTQNSSFTAIAAGITHADVQAGANIASGATLTVSGTLTVAATNVGSYSNEVTSKTGTNGRAAAAIAYSDHQSGVNASLNADVGDATKVEIIAINEVLKDQAVATSKVGGSQTDAIIESGREKVSAMTGVEEFFWGKLGLQDLKPDNKSSPTQQSFRIGGAIAYDTSSHKALAEIGDDTTVHVTDSVAVVSRVRAEEMKIAAEAAAVSTSSKEPSASDTARQAYSVGLAIANYHHDAVSRVGANAIVTAPKIAVYSDTLIPIRDSLLFGSKDATDNWTRWDGLETIQGALESITNIFDVFNGVSTAKSKSDGSDGSIGLSGSVSILNYDDQSRAIIDSGAQLNVTGAETGKWSTSLLLQPEKKNYDELTGTILLSTDPEVKEDFEFAAPVSVQAKHDATLLFQAGELLPSSSGEKGLGVAFNQIGITSETEAVVREGVVIQGVTETATAQPGGSRVWTQTGTFETEQVDVSAKSDERIISLAISGGYGATFGLNGTYSQVELNNSTHALVDDEVTIKAKVLDVKAQAAPVVWSLSGGINMSKNASVGIGIAINDVMGSTRAEIADNDTWSLDDAPRSSLLNIVGSGINSSDIEVEAKTGGRLEAIAITGALANKGSSSDSGSGSGGFAAKLKDKVGYTKVLGVAGGLAGLVKDDVKKQDAGGAEQESAKKPPSFSFAGAGSGAINLSEMMTTAKVEAIKINQTAVTPASLAIRAIADSDIAAASGAAAITRANNPETTKTVGVAGSVAVNSIGNGTQAWLKDSTVTDAGDVTVQALSGGEQLAIALGMAVDATTASTQTKSDSFVGSLSLTLAQTDDNDDSKNKTIAKIDNTDITGKAGETGRDVDVTAYNRTYIGTGGGSLALKVGAAGKGTSIGAAVSWANVRNDVEAGIVGDSTVSSVDTVGVHAYNATEIGAGAAMLGLSNAEGQNSFAGSLVVNQITNNTTASIEKSTITATAQVEVQALDKGADSVLETLIDPDGDRDNTAKGLDYCGESADGASPSGNCITAVAGTVQVGQGNNFGVSIAYNQIENNLTAKVKDSTVDVTGTDGANQIVVNAESDTSILGVAFGVGVSATKMSGAGSLSIAGIENNVVAEVGQSETDGRVTTLTAPTVKINSTDDSIITTVAGQVNVSVKDKALGAAFAYNEINNATRSVVDTATITAQDEIEITATEKAKIETLSATGGLGKDAVSLSASLNFIDNTSEARVTDSYFKDGGANATTDTNTVAVKAEDASTIRSLAGSVALGMTAGAGAAFSLNQVSNTNTALVDNSTIESVDDFELKAIEKAVIETLAVAVGKGMQGFAGSITLNNIGQSFVGSHPNTTTAELKGSTVRYGSGSSITIEGRDESKISSLAGSVAIGSGLSGSAFGAAVADNNIQSTAKGTVTDSTIADNTSLDVTGFNKATIKSASLAGSGATGGAFAGSASSNRTENKTYGEIIGSDITGSTSDVNVKATNESNIQALSGGAALSSGPGAVGIAISVNDIDDTTTADVTDKKVSGYTVKDMQVAAASDATIKALSIGAAGSTEGSAGAGSVGVSLISSNTSAYIDGDAVVLAENNVGVTAASDDAITVISGSAGIGAGAAGVGVGFNVNSITSNTKAYISGANTSVTGLAKDANEVMDVYNGELTTGVNLANQVDTLTFAALDLKNNKATESVSGVVVNASSSQQIENITGTIGASSGIGAGVAAGVNVIGGTTQAYVLNAKINDTNAGAGTDQKVAITASNIAYDNSFIVAVGIGSNAGGLGVDTHVMNRTTSAKVIGGSINAKNTVAVKAESTQGISSLAAGGAAAAGGNAGAGTLALALFDNTTEALVSGADVIASDLEIKAKNTNDMFLMAGAVSIGGNAGGGAFAVGTSDSTTKATLSNTDVTASGAVNVDAINKTDINHIVVSGAGGGGVGIAGMADVNLVTDKTEATIEDSTIGTSSAKAASVHVAATHTVDVDSKAGALGVGISGGGVGAGASVNIIKANTVATVSDSTIYADGEMDVTAVSTKHVDATALTAGVGGTVGIGGAAVVTLVGDDVSGDASDEVDGSLSAVDDFTSGGKFEDLPDTGAGGPVILSQTDQDSLNSDTQKSTTGVTGSAGGYTFKTAAEINGSNTLNTGSLDVIATDKTDTKSLVGGFGASLGGGVGGGVAVTNVKANVAANVSGTVLTTNGDINVKASADNDNGKTIDILALAGGAGLVGVGAAVSYADIRNHVDANLSSGANAGAGTVTVTAEDKTDIESDAKGAAVGAGAAGVVISNAEKHSTINASAGGVVTAGSATISATDEGLVKAIGQSAVAGLSAGVAGAIVDAADVSNISALTADNTTFNLGGGSLNLIATGTPQTSARADGVAVSAGLGIGASMAHADSSATIKATMGSNNTVTASELSIKAIRALNTSGVPSSFAKAFGASGGLLLGANATVAEAFSGGSTMASVGSDSTLSVSGTTTVKGESESQQTSSGLGFSGGIVAIGSDYSEAKSSTYTSAALGSDVKVTGSRLDVLATSEDTNYAYGVAGSGGAISAPFSEAKTINESQTYASTGSGNNTLGDERKIAVTSLNITAKHDAHFDSWMENTNASLLGASGAKATNTVSAITGASIGEDGYIEADNVTLDATNVVVKASPVTIPGLSVSVPSWNVNSSSGGLADVPAAGSSTIIATQALVQVGDSAHLEQTGLQSAPGVFTLNALNNVTATDKVKMSSGGLVSAASGESSILADTNNATVHVGDNSVTTGMGDIAMGARSIADISTQTAVDVYGLVGVAPAGDSVSSFHSNNTINIGAASIESLNDIKLSAGANTVGEANDMRTTARSDVYNNTVIPANRDPVADAIIDTHSQINIASGADLGAVRHIALFAEKGSAIASGVGIGKDIYREALAKVASAVSNAFGGGDVSFETKTGNSITSQTSDVTVNGELHVGIHRKQSLEIGFDGLATSQTDGISITNTDFKAVAADILDRIDALNELIRKYTVEDADADASIAVAAYQSEIKFLERKLKDINPSADSGFNGVADISAMQAAQSSVDGMTQTRDDYQTTKNQLTSDNTTLTSSNTTLTDDNTSLTTSNATLQSEIDALDPTDDAAVIATKQAMINSNTSTINSNTSTITINEGLIEDLTAKITPLDTTILATQTDIDNDVFSTTIVGGPVAKILTVSDAVAQLGNIYVRADELQGDGSLDAPGDAEIKIVNNGSSFLKLNDLIIPPDEGGKIYLNSIDVNDNTEINGVNGSTGADFTIFTADSQIDSAGNAVTPGKPQILIESKYDPLNPYYIAQTPDGTPTLAPDIIMKGEVSNLRGLVKVDSAAGSIRVEETANIRAGTVDIKTKNGDFVQSYADTMFHVNGAPLTTIPGDPLLAFDGNVDSIVRTPELAGGGIVANGSVLISARYLNVNGNIQSGIPEWGVKIPGAATVKIGATSGTFAQAQTTYNALTDAQKEVLGSEFYSVDGATVAGLAGNEQGNWEKIDVYYNAKENRLELGGVQVQGGYIELFGEVFNTNSQSSMDIASNIGGKLRVLDGYGQINVDNQTDLALWVNLLDTGRGVQGEINISNITGLDANNAPVITTQTFTRNSGGARTGQTYSPTSGLGYSMMVGYDSMITDYYRYSQNGWFGITEAPVLDQYKIDSITTDNDPLSRAEFLQNTPGLDVTNEVTETTNTSSAPAVAGSSWKDCNWWTACANATYYQEYTVARGDKTTRTQSVKADNPINIEFIGFDNGTVNVASTGNVVFNSAVNSRNGDISVSSGGSITQNGDLAIMNGNNISLNSASGMGDASQSLLLNVNSGGKLDATSVSGELHLTQVVGDLQVGSIGGAGVSKVVLEAERSLLGVDADSKVQAQRVELLARNGGIGELSGSADTQFKVITGYTTDQSQWSDKGLIATARDNVNVINTGDANNASVYSGNLLLISAESQTGDVHIETTGKVIDNNPFATTDTRTQNELADLWDSMALRGALAEDKADESVAAYARGQENNYKLYWQLRALQADGGANYDAAFEYQLSQPQTDAMIESGMTTAQIAEFADSRTKQYHQLNTQVGGFTTAFDDGYSYDVAGIESNIREGSSWSDAQLQLSVGSGLLKNITDTVTTIKTPNVKGNNISLIAGADIGSFDDALTIDLTAPLTSLTIEQKAALAAAERGDVTVNGDILSIIQARPVNITIGTGSLNADANGLLLIGSEKDLSINQVATTGDIRIKTAGALINAASAGVVNIEGQNMILEAANGGIGSETAPLLLDAEFGSGVTARAKNDIWLKSLFDFNIDTMYSPNNINIDAQGSIFDFQTTEVLNNEDLNIRGNYVMLTAQNGSIGTAVNALDVSVNKDGLMSVDASTLGQGVYLNGTYNESFRVGSVTSGNETILTSADDVVLAEGTVISVNNIKLEAGTDGTGSVDVKEESNNGYVIDASTTLEVIAANDIALTGRISAQGNVSLDAGDNVLLSGGSITGANQVTLNAGKDGSGSLEVDEESASDYAIDSTSTLVMTAANGMTIKGKIRSQDTTDLVTGDDIILAGGSITSDAAVALNAGTDGSGSIEVNEESAGSYAIDTESTLDMTAANAVTIKGRIHSKQTTNFVAGDDIALTGGSINSTGNVNLESGSDGSGSTNIEFSNPDFNSVETTETLVLTAADDINVNANIRANSGLEFNAGHAMNLTGGAISTSGAVDIASDDTLTIGGEVFGGAGIAITTPNDVVFSGGRLTSDNDINIEAGTDGSGNILGSSTGGTDIIALGTLDLQALNSIGGVNALVAEVSNQANFRAADINVEVSSTPLNNPLSLSVSDIGGGPSNNVEMKVNSNRSVTFDTFNVGVAHVTADTPSLQVPNGEITNYAVFNMPLYNTRFDTLNQDDHPGYDVNAYTLSGDFSLNSLANSVTVGAFVLQQNPDLEWIVKKPENVEDKVQTILQPTQEGSDSDTNNPKGINMQASGQSMFQKPYIDGSLVDVSLNWFTSESPVINTEIQQDSEDKKEIEN